MCFIFFSYFAVKQKITSSEQSATASAGEQELQLLANTAINLFEGYLYYFLSQ